MHLLGCLVFGLFFFLILGVSVLGSVVNVLWRLFTGMPLGSTRPQQREEQKKASQREEQDYKFRPEDGEYIDYEEV